MKLEPIPLFEPNIDVYDMGNRCKNDPYGINGSVGMVFKTPLEVYQSNEIQHGKTVLQNSGRYGPAAGVEEMLNFQGQLILGKTRDEIRNELGSIIGTNGGTGALFVTIRELMLNREKKTLNAVKVYVKNPTFSGYFKTIEQALQPSFSKTPHIYDIQGGLVPFDGTAVYIAQIINEDHNPSGAKDGETYTDIQQNMVKLIEMYGEDKVHIVVDCAYYGISEHPTVYKEIFQTLWKEFPNISITFSNSKIHSTYSQIRSGTLLMKNTVKSKQSDLDQLLREYTKGSQVSNNMGMDLAILKAYNGCEATFFTHVDRLRDELQKRGSRFADALDTYGLSHETIEKIRSSKGMFFNFPRLEKYHQELIDKHHYYMAGLGRFNKGTFCDDQIIGMVAEIVGPYMKKEGY